MASFLHFLSKECPFGFHPSVSFRNSPALVPPTAFKQTAPLRGSCGPVCQGVVFILVPTIKLLKRQLPRFGTYLSLYCRAEIIIFILYSSLVWSIFFCDVGMLIWLSSFEEVTWVENIPSFSTNLPILHCSTLHFWWIWFFNNISLSQYCSRSSWF